MGMLEQGSIEGAIGLLWIWDHVERQHKSRIPGKNEHHLGIVQKEGDEVSCASDKLLP